MTSLFPIFLVGGALVAGAAVALHLLSRRPPDRRALPTARFLDEEPRTLLRLQRTPADRRLLLVRVLFALVLGAAFAGIVWAPDRTGTTHFVLVDVDGLGVGGAGDATEEVDAAVELAGRDGATVEVVRYGASDGMETRTPAITGLRALKAALHDAASVDSAEVSWVLRSDWSQWSSGVGTLRAATWPGAITLRPIGPQSSVEPSTSPADAVETRVGADPGLRADLRTGFAPDAAVARAVTALGVLATEADDSAEAEWVFVEDPSADEFSALIAEARRGRTIIVSGRLPSTGTDGETPFPWVTASGARSAGSERAEARSNGGTEARLLGNEGVVGEPVEREGGGPARGSRAIAFFEDLAPAASAVSVDEGCLVYFATSLQTPALTRAPGYVEVVAALMSGCAAADSSTPLDAGALRTLARSDLPQRIAMADVLRGPDGTTPRLGSLPGLQLTPFLLLLALLLLGLESWFTREGRR